MKKWELLKERVLHIPDILYHKENGYAEAFETLLVQLENSNGGFLWRESMRQIRETVKAKGG